MIQVIIKKERQEEFWTVVKVSTGLNHSDSRTEVLGQSTPNPNPITRLESDSLERESLIIDS